MPQRDYLLNLLEQAIEAIIQVTKYRREGRYDLSIHTVIASMEKLFGLKIGDLGSLSVDQIFNQLTEGEQPLDARNKCLVFAALNYQTGLTYAERDLAALAQPAFYLALVFTLRAWERFPRSDPPPFTPDVANLLPRLEGFALSPPVLELIEAHRREPAAGSPSP